MLLGFSATIVNYLIGIVYGVVFFTALEATTGRSIGKYVTQTKVIDADGNKPSFETILIRSLCRYIPFDGFSFLGESGSGWHDTLSKTRVVKI